MKSKFEDIMSQHSDEELIKILNSKEGDYQPEAKESAHKEAKKRNLDSNANIEVSEQLNVRDETHIIEKKYPALRFISTVFKIMAWVTILLIVLFIIYSFTADSELIEGLIVIYSGFILFVIMLGVSEVIKVFIDIEHNTRITANNTSK